MKEETTAARGYSDSELLDWFADRINQEGWLAFPCRDCGRHGRLSTHTLHEAIRELLDERGELLAALRGMVDEIPAGLWRDVREKAKREGISLRALLSLLEKWLKA